MKPTIYRSGMRLAPPRNVSHLLAVTDSHEGDRDVGRGPVVADKSGHCPSLRWRGPLVHRHFDLVPRPTRPTVIQKAGCNNAFRRTRLSKLITINRLA